MHGIPLISLFQFRAVRFYPADVSGNLSVFRKLIVLYFIGYFIRDNFPAFPAVIWDRIGIKITDMLTFFLHIFQGLLQKLMHQSHVGIFRISSYAGQSPHRVGFSKNPRLHGINRHLGYKGVAVEPSDHIGLFHGREFGPDDLPLLPSDGTQLLLCHLKHIPEKCVVLFHIFAAYCFYFQILFIHSKLPLIIQCAKSILRCLYCKTSAFLRKRTGPILKMRDGTWGYTRFLLILPARSDRRYCLFSYTQRLPDLSRHYRIRRNYVPGAPSVRRRLPDTWV